MIGSGSKQLTGTGHQENVRDITLYHGERQGWIEVITGVMFSGKSEELIRRLRRALIAGRKVQIFKSSLDDRYHGVHRISTHQGSHVESLPVTSALELARMVASETEVVGIDEAQFLDDGIAEVVDALANRGCRVIIAGTDMDFRGEPFGPMPALLTRAETVDKLHAICMVCGSPATRNQRLVDGKPAQYDAPTIQVGGAEEYEARCRRCHEVPSPNRLQTSLLDALDFDPPGARILTWDRKPRNHSEA